MNNFLRISILLFLISFSCAAQKQNRMITFDIETFNNKKVRKEYTFIDKDSTLIIQTERQLEYQETIKHKNSYFETINRYYKSGKLKVVSQFYPDRFQKGIRKEYDEQGNLIKETNYDAPYKFTWEDILKSVSYTHLTLPTIYSV